MERFTPRVAKGDAVAPWRQVLAEVDLDVIREAGYDYHARRRRTRKKLGAITPVVRAGRSSGDALLDVGPHACFRESTAADQQAGAAHPSVKPAESGARLW